MKLDEEYLTDTPVFAQLVREKAVGMAGALELLSDEYQPPKELKLSCIDSDEGEGEGEDKDESDIEHGDGDEHGDPESEEPTPASMEVDAEGYPAIVKIAPVAPPTPPKGVKLIRPRTLSHMHQA